VPPLFPPLEAPGAGEALRVEGRSLSWRELAGCAAALVPRLAGRERVAVWATPVLETCVATIAAIRAGTAAVPTNP
jgi:malonyl-CoA/methylmalonyl-CoA synthetase